MRVNSRVTGSKAGPLRFRNYNLTLRNQVKTLNRIIYAYAIPILSHKTP